MRVRRSPVTQLQAKRQSQKSTPGGHPKSPSLPARSNDQRVFNERNLREHDGQQEDSSATLAGSRIGTRANKQPGTLHAQPEREAGYFAEWSRHGDVNASEVESEPNYAYEPGSADVSLLSRSGRPRSSGYPSEAEPLLADMRGRERAERQAMGALPLDSCQYLIECPCGGPAPPLKSFALKGKNGRIP